MVPAGALRARHRQPALLRDGLRRFFLGGALWAAGALGLWLAVLQGAIRLPSVLAPAIWHQHEMLFG